MLWKNIVLEIHGVRDKPFKLKVRNSYDSLLEVFGTNTLYGNNNEGRHICLKGLGILRITGFCFVTLESKVVVKTMFEGE